MNDTLVREQDFFCIYSVPDFVYQESRFSHRCD